MADLTTLIKTVIDACVENSKKSAIKSGSMTAKMTVSHLLALSRTLEKSINLDTTLYSIAVSYGAGFFPKVPWIAITNKGKKVSNSVSVALCFSSKGEGFVCGAMFFKRKKKGKFQTTDRIGEHISLEGGSTKSDYTNRYFNPKDFYTNNIKTNELVQHIQSSIAFMNEVHISKELLTI